MHRVREILLTALFALDHAAFLSSSMILAAEPCNLRPATSRKTVFQGDFDGLPTLERSVILELSAASGSGPNFLEKFRNKLR